MRTALIVGIGGQDGSYLAELLLGKGYRVYGLVRHAPSEVPSRLAHVADQLTLLRGDLVDQGSLIAAVERAQPDEVYNFAGTSFVPESWQQPLLTIDYTGMGAVRLLEAIRRTNPEIRFYQASTSEMFGRPQTAPQNEQTAVDPRNPYAAAKVLAHHMVERYRDGYGIFAVAGILYNHESPRRPPEFVSRKLARAAAAISLGLETSIALGDLTARRDWGFAGDYVRAMWLMLQQDEPRTYVIATGKLHSVEDLAEAAFGHVGLDWRDHVLKDDTLLRRDDDPAQLVGDPTLARERLGWEPSISFGELVALLVEADLARLDDEREYTAALDWPRAQSPL